MSGSWRCFDRRSDSSTPMWRVDRGREHTKPFEQVDSDKHDAGDKDCPTKPCVGRFPTADPDTNESYPYE